MAAEENNAMAISGRCRSHPIAIVTKVTDDANDILAIISPQFTNSLTTGKSSIKGGRVDHSIGNWTNIVLT